MKVYSFIEIDIDTGKVYRETSFEYNGPIVKCDRAMQAAGQQAIKGAEQTAGQYGATAGQVGGFLIPQLERQSVTPTGYSPMDEAAMQTQALLGGAAESGKAREEATLRAARTGNAAALPGQEAAITEAGARGTGSMLQNILTKNAQLKAQQQELAQKELGGLYGTAARSQLEGESLLPQDIGATTKAGESGWLQNTLDVLSIMQGKPTKF